MVKENKSYISSNTKEKSKKNIFSKVLDLKLDVMRKYFLDEIMFVNLVKFILFKMI